MNKPLTLSEKKRQAILEAAINAFDRNGYQKTSMDQIAAEAQVSKRTVYNHFPSKEALFEAITAIVWEKGMQATDYAYTPEVQVEQQLAAIAEQELVLLKGQAYIRLSRVVIGECLSSSVTAAEIMSKFEQTDSGLKRWLKAAVADGKIVDDVDFIAEQFFSLIKGFCFWPQVIGYGEFPDDQACEKIVASAVRMITSEYLIQV